MQIVDEYAERVMPGRRWSDGLHQAVEAKEGIKVDSEESTSARISYQPFFRLFEKVAEMTGTAVVRIPTALSMGRKDYPDVVLKNSTGKYRGVTREICRVVSYQQAVLF